MIKSLFAVICLIGVMIAATISHLINDEVH